MSQHDAALRALTSWTAPDAEQESLRATYVEHLRAHDDGLTRACTPAHLTAGVLVIDHDGERVLLNLHRKAQRWFHFGGHIEPDDVSLLAAATREGHEESGLAAVEMHPDIAQLDTHLVAFCGDHPQVAHLDVRYVARAPRDADFAASEESLAVRWWPIAGLERDLPELEPRLRDLVTIAQTRFS